MAGNEFDHLPDADSVFDNLPDAGSVAAKASGVASKVAPRYIGVPSLPTASDMKRRIADATPRTKKKNLPPAPDRQRNAPGIWTPPATSDAAASNNPKQPVSETQGHLSPATDYFQKPTVAVRKPTPVPANYMDFPKEAVAAIGLLNPDLAKRIGEAQYQAMQTRAGSPSRNSADNMATLAPRGFRGNDPSPNLGKDPVETIRNAAKELGEVVGSNLAGSLAGPMAEGVGKTVGGGVGAFVGGVASAPIAMPLLVDSMVRDPLGTASGLLHGLNVTEPGIAGSERIERALNLIATLFGAIHGVAKGGALLNELLPDVPITLRSARAMDALSGSLLKSSAFPNGFFGEIHDASSGVQFRVPKQDVNIGFGAKDGVTAAPRPGAVAPEVKISAGSNEGPTVSQAAVSGAKVPGDAFLDPKLQSVWRERTQALINDIKRAVSSGVLGKQGGRKAAFFKGELEASLGQNKPHPAIIEEWNQQHDSAGTGGPTTASEIGVDFGIGKGRKKQPPQPTTAGTSKPDVISRKVSFGAEGPVSGKGNLWQQGKSETTISTPAQKPTGTTIPPSEIKLGATGKVGEAAAPDNVGSTPTASTKPSAGVPAEAPVSPVQPPEAATRVETPPKPNVSPETHTAAANVINDAERAAADLPAAIRPKMGTIKAWVETAIEQGMNTRARQIAERALQLNERLSHTQQMGLNVRKLEIQKEVEANLAKQDLLIEDGLGDKASRKAHKLLVEQEHDLHHEYDIITSALSTTGSELGAALGSRRVLIRNDFSVSGLLARAKREAAKNDAPFTTADENKYKQLAKDISSAEKEYADQEAEVARHAAEQVVRGHVANAAPATRAPERLADIRARREKIKANMDKILKESMSSAHSIGNVGYNVAKMSVEVGKYVGTLVEEGVYRLDDVVTRLMADIPAIRTREEAHYLISRSETPPVQRPGLGAKGRIVREAKMEAEQARLDAGTWTPKTKADRELIRSLDVKRYNLDRAKKQALISLNEQGQHWTHRVAKEIYALPRGLQATMDMSAVLRQGLVLGVANPAHASKAFVKATRAMFDPVYANRLSHEMHNNPVTPYLKRAGLFIADVEGGLLHSEEAYASNFLTNVRIGGRRGVPVIKQIIEGSERHYTTFLNELRFGVATDMIRRFPDMPKEQAGALMRFINAATGRGSLIKDGTTASHIFFSPRFMSSRFEILAQPFNVKAWVQNPALRKQMAQAYGGLAVMATTLMGLAKAGGAEIGSDPNDATFGKILDGDTKVDIFGGLLPEAKLAMNLFNLGRATMHHEPNYKEQQSWKEDIANFLRYKLAPVPNAVLNNFLGEDAVGNRFGRDDTGQRDWGAFAKDNLMLLIPLVAGDVYKAVTDEKSGPTTKTLSTLGSIFGVGVQVYDKDRKRPKPYKP